MDPERDLWAAVLDQAIDDYACGAYALRTDGPYAQNSARTWFLSDRRGLGSFLFICDIFDLDPQWFRKQLFGSSPDKLRQKSA